MRSVVFTAIAAICTSLGAQTPPARPQFEVASVKPAAGDDMAARFPLMRELMRSQRGRGVIPMPDPGRIRLQNWVLLDLISAAYGVLATQVSGPAWISEQGFNIEAKLPTGARKEDVNAMLQSLLEERFGLRVHRESQTKQGYALVVGKNGPKLKPAEPEHAPETDLTEEEKKARATQQRQAMMAGMMERMKENRENGAPLTGLKTSSWDSITTRELADRLVRLAETPVVDETGLTGKYSVDLETWNNPDVPGGTVFAAVQKLGLKLEPRKLTVEVVVVDQVSKTPTAN